MSTKNGLFITFEGGEGAGKTTQIKLLRDNLIDMGFSVICTREPGGTAIGEELRRLVKHVHGEDAPRTTAELLIFAASRAQHMEQLIIPHLRKGGIVICDRFVDSTTAYQGYGRQINMDIIHKLNEIAVCGRMPDLTVLLSLSVEKSIERRLKREASGDSVQDRLEKEPVDFFKRVSNGFMKIALEDQERFAIINADDTIGSVMVQIEDHVNRKLKEVGHL